jgi:L-asparaginase / beta-aspartyl-peptidase
MQHQGIVVASSNGRVGIGEAVRVLRAGGSALDAVEAGVRLVEDNLDDDSVGTGGLPNLLCEVQLDASIMDGRTLMSGAVGALRGYPNPISVARRVMSDTPHALIAGTGAERFAEECGFARADLLTPAAKQRYEEWLEGKTPVSGPQHRAYLERSRALAQMVRVAAEPERTHGTTNFLARDRDGNIASAVSTSGWAWAFPGRLGDSPVIGAGNYCDNRYGAAACTGRGEMAVRAGTARSVVLYMKMGMSAPDALAEAMRDLWAQQDDYYGNMNIVALDRDGNPAAASNRESTFVYQREEMEAYTEQPRLLVVSADPAQAGGWSSIARPAEKSDRQ